MASSALLLKLPPACVLLSEIGVDLLAAAQVKGNGAMNLFQTQRREVGRNHLWQFTRPVRVND